MSNRNTHCLLIALITILFVGCASVPKEVVELSYLVGEDLEAVHLSYKTLIRTHYDGLRDQAQTFLQEKWVPIFLEDFIERAGLVEAVKSPDPVEVLDYVQVWAEAAIEEIEVKKKELLDPIKEDERTLIESVDAAFANLMRANATITAHLNSIRKVKEVEDEVLDSMGLKKLRDNVNNQLIKSSQELKDALEKLDKLEVQIEDAKEKKEELIDKLEGE